jgi:hypothetical protein
MSLTGKVGMANWQGMIRESSALCWDEWMEVNGSGNLQLGVDVSQSGPGGLAAQGHFLFLPGFAGLLAADPCFPSRIEGFLPYA